MKFYHISDVTGRKELPFLTSVEPFISQFMVTFDFEILKDKNNYKSHRRISSVPRSMSISLDTSSTRSTKSVAPSYQLTPVTLDYIKTESPLVATLVSLVCSDELDDIEEHFEEEYFTKSENLRGRTPSEMSLMDVRSYRYQKLTDEFPTVKRRLLNYVIPIAGAEDSEILRGKDSLLKLITSNFSSRVRACMLTLHGNHEYENVLNAILQDLMADKKYSAMLNIMRSLPESQLRSRHRAPSLAALHDFVLTCNIKEHLGSRSNIKEYLGSRSNIKEHLESRSTKDKLIPDTNSSHLSKEAGNMIVSLLHQFISCDSMARTLLSVYTKLTMDQNIELFHLCLHSNISSDLYEFVNKKLTDLKMYNKVK